MPNTPFVFIAQASKVPKELVGGLSEAGHQASAISPTTPPYQILTTLMESFDPISQAQLVFLSVPDEETVKALTDAMGVAPIVVAQSCQLQTVAWIPAPCELDRLLVTAAANHPSWQGALPDTAAAEADLGYAPEMEPVVSEPEDTPEAELPSRPNLQVVPSLPPDPEPMPVESNEPPPRPAAVAEPGGFAEPLHVPPPSAPRAEPGEAVPAPSVEVEIEPEPVFDTEPAAAAEMEPLASPTRVADSPPSLPERPPEPTPPMPTRISPPPTDAPGPLPEVAPPARIVPPTQPPSVVEPEPLPPAATEVDQPRTEADEPLLQWEAPTDSAETPPPATVEAVTQTSPAEPAGPTTPEPSVSLPSWMTASAQPTPEPAPPPSEPPAAPPVPQRAPVVEQAASTPAAVSLPPEEPPVEAVCAASPTPPVPEAMPPPAEHVQTTPPPVVQPVVEPPTRTSEPEPEPEPEPVFQHMDAAPSLNPEVDRPDVTSDPNYGSAPWANQLGGRRSRQSEGLVLLVCAAKGGVGKTSFSLFLSQALTAAGRSVALVDANVGQPDITKALSVFGATVGITNLANKVRFTDEELEAACLFVSEVGTVLGGPPEPITVNLAPSIAALGLALERLKLTHDFVVVDTPVATVHESVVTGLIPKADVVTVVLNPHDITLHDTVVWMGEAEKPASRGGQNLDREKCVAVMNRADDLAGRTSAQAEGWLNLRIVAELPLDKNLVGKTNEGEWRCPPSLQQGLATYIDTVCNVGVEQTVAKKKRGGLFKRFRNK